MSSRLYFSDTIVPAVSPAYDASWEVTASAIRRSLIDYKVGSETQRSAASALNSPAAAVDVLVAQYTSPALSGAQTITGTVKGQIRANESASALAVAQMLVWVMAPDGSNRGTLLAHNTTYASQFTTSSTPANRKFPLGGAAALSSVAAQDGDYIVIEVGWRRFANDTTNRTGRLNLGAAAGTDLPENETATSGTPWVEFSQSLAFVGGTVIVTQAYTQVLRRRYARERQIFVIAD